MTNKINSNRQYYIDLLIKSDNNNEQNIDFLESLPMEDLVNMVEELESSF
jgi:hypothetical protein